MPYRKQKISISATVPQRMRTRFVSRFQASDNAAMILRTGRILKNDETPQEMIERVVETLFSVEKRFGTSHEEITRLMHDFGALLDDKHCVMSTPIMNNAGRYVRKPLSACAVPPVDLKQDLHEVKNIINRFHADGMGTGFCLDETDEPLVLLRYLNQIAVEGAKSGKEDRPVGNMAVLSVHHPSILSFIRAKRDVDHNAEEWKFNISVNVSEEFMQAVTQRSTYTLWNGEKLDAYHIMEEIAGAAHKCGDPGLVFIDRLNKDNPTPAVGEYTSTAPCGEVGLSPGETCQFGYINLGKFVAEGEQPTIDYAYLEKATRLMTRALDNAIEFSLEKYPHPLSKNVMRAKRKIGIGICGLADMLIRLRIPYDEPEARHTAKNLVSFINYISKKESHELAKQRGSFDSLVLPTGSRYTDGNGFIEAKYGNLSTDKVHSSQWRNLGQLIRNTRLLRNSSTIALPPTGRSGLVVDASNGVEPVFSLIDYRDSINQHLIKDLRSHDLLTSEVEQRIRTTGKIGDIEHIPEKIRNIYKTALELKPNDHLLMLEAVQQVVDESISKTINMPENSSRLDIVDTYIKAYNMNLKGITVYRTGSRMLQPKALATV